MLRGVAYHDTLRTLWSSWTRVSIVTLDSLQLWWVLGVKIVATHDLHMEGGREGGRERERERESFILL